MSGLVGRLIKRPWGARSGSRQSSGGVGESLCLCSVSVLCVLCLCLCLCFVALRSSWNT